EIGDYEADLGIGAYGHAAKIEVLRRDPKLSRSQTYADHRVGGITAVAVKAYYVAETAGANGSKTDHHLTRVAWRQIERIIALNTERESGGDTADQGLATSVSKLEAQCVGLANDHRAEVQIGWAEGQLRR